VSVLILIVSLLVYSCQLFAQAVGGDQFLDGIGGTVLFARYVLNGNTKDWSRNNYHATLHGTEAAYVKDSQFGKVLSLPVTASIRLLNNLAGNISTFSPATWPEQVPKILEVAPISISLYEFKVR
jgi:hypothetical protein